MSFKDVDLGGEGGKFFKINDGENRLRIVSEPVLVWTSFNKVEGTSKKYLTSEAASKDDGVKKRYAMYVIDRADGKIKHAEFGVSIMKGIKTLANASETSFDGLPPYDMIITRTGSGMETEYAVFASRKETELTEEEKIEVSKLEDLRNVLREDAEDKDQVAPF